MEPALQPLQVPVRAVVLHVGDPAAARALSAAVARHMSPLAQDAGLWLQDPAKYHATLFHASTHEVSKCSKTVHLHYNELLSKHMMVVEYHQLE